MEILKRAVKAMYGLGGWILAITLAYVIVIMFTGMFGGFNVETTVKFLNIFQMMMGLLVAIVLINSILYILFARTLQGMIKDTLQRSLNY